jgi:hypothetical protein
MEYFKLWAQIRPAQCGRVAVSASISQVSADIKPPGAITPFGNMATAVQFFKSRKEAEAAAESLVSRFSAGSARHPLITTITENGQLSLIE